ncbi:hypothetical protein [Pseudonocardia charpentierae]|uniref:Uncharacterized protein n=1 Tax=Pseudonocardia charpentierae TaxID=3075545 RepID=A0ABU2NL45_9PSEU|nr:hypothetical protein [Pseudonocardia sp. DSM 45834]MDT0353738.1 hypothetical protein [Pseudonocardia sp. DSM 45834]
MTSTSAAPSLRRRWLAHVDTLPDAPRPRIAGAVRDARGRLTGGHHYVKDDVIALRPSERAVAVALGSLADSDGCASPGVLRIAATAGVCTERTAHALATLGRLGLLHRDYKFGHGRMDRFWLELPDGG